MASYTPNLDLLKKSPVTDGDDMFNVETMLNENWDRIDRGVGDYTTPAQKMGLTGDLSVGASLGVLANIGNVHVWRKTVVAEEEIPAGYTLGPVQNSNIITYLTSVNRNAYQEGDDAKEAGYVLGDMVSGYLFASAWTGNASNYYYSETIKVSDTGTLTQENVKSYTANATNDSWVSNIQSAIRGKFITVSGEKDNGGSEGTNLVYIPDDAIVSYFENGVSLGYPYNYGFLVNKMQQVTGYPAIPAGTTIEYLGVLGDKIRMQIVSYIGTGTSGEATPCSITADFKFKTAEYLGSLRGGSLSPAVTYIDARDKVLSEAITTEFTAYSGFCLDDSQDSFGKKSEDGKTITWYSIYNNRQSNQLNEAGVKYYFRFFG